MGRQICWWAFSAKTVVTPARLLAWAAYPNTVPIEIEMIVEVAD